MINPAQAENSNDDVRPSVMVDMTIRYQRLHQFPKFEYCTALIMMVGNEIGRFLRLRWNTHCCNNASFDSLLYRAGLGQLGKGWIVRGTTTIEDCLTGLTGSSTQVGTGYTDLQLIGSSVADYQALT